MSLLLSRSSLTFPMSHHHVDNADDPRSCALDATSSDPWGPSHALLAQLCQFTHNARHCADVLHVLSDALNATGPQWRRVLKALTTLAHCLRHPSPEITLFATSHRTLLHNLTQFQYVDPYRLDRGAAVREEAQVVMALMMKRKEESPLPLSGRSYITPVTATPVTATTTITPHAPRPPAGQTSASLGPLFPTHPSHVFPRPSHPTPLTHARHRRDFVQESIHDSTTLDVLLSHLESLPAPTSAFGSDDTWLNIYKLLFLLNTSLPTASDDTIRYWVGNRGLLARVIKEAGRTEKCGGSAREREGKNQANVSSQSIAWEVKRLAGELMGALEEGEEGVGEVRRRVRLF